MATVTVAQQKLVLNAFAAIFESNLVSGDAVSWKEYDTELDDRNGLQVVEQVRPHYSISQTTNGVKDLSSGVDDTVFGSEVFAVNKTFNANMGWGDFAKIQSVGDVRENEALQGAATSLAEQIDAYVLSTTFLAANNWTGTAGNNIADFNDVMSGYVRLKKEGVADAGMRAILAVDDQQGLQNQLGKLYSDTEAQKAIRNGFSGKLGNIPTMFTTQVPKLTTGSRAGDGSSAALINGANQNVNYSAVATSSANGGYMTQTLAIDTLTGADTLKKGDVFTIAGVYAYDNRKQAAHSHLQQFVVTADATASSGAIAALSIFPAIIVPATGSGGDVNVNTAHATVDSIPADNAALTIKGAASTGYTLRGIVDKQAVTVATAPLILPYTDTAMRRKLQNVPLSVRMWQHSDFGTGAHLVRFDVALTANIRDRRRICRVNGS